MLKKLGIVIGIIIAIVLIVIFVKNYTRTVNIYNYEYKDGTVFIDLDGDEKKEEITLHRNGKTVDINQKSYIINKHYNTEVDAFAVMRAGSDNYYYILDINKDRYLDVILQTIDETISPPTTYYTIFNYDNGTWKEIADMSMDGSLPKKIKVVGNTITFEYHPEEAKEEYMENKSIKLDV